MAGWLDPAERRIGLGCMRLSTDEQRDEERSLDVIAAAVAAGATVFDTARAYGRDATELGHNERLVARALRRCGAADLARIVTKGGMSRDGGWLPDGRAKAVRADCEASLTALDGLPIDLYLLHSPDPHTPWRTSVRALGRLLEDGLVRRIGVCNVNRQQLDEALELAPLAAVQVALGAFDDQARRGGVVERCEERGLALLAHSPLGGPRRAGRLARHPVVGEIAARHHASPAEVVLAWLVALSPAVVAIPGARRPETARSAVRAGGLPLSADDRVALDRSLHRRQPVAPVVRRPTGSRAAASQAEAVVLVGIPGAGKTRLAGALDAEGTVRLNRDERGGSLTDVAAALDEALAAGAERIVLDNTNLTRAARSHITDVTRRHGATARAIWLDTPLAQAQRNLVLRLLDRFGHLPSPEQLRTAARHEAGIMAPTSQMRALRQLEPPTTEEGFATVQRVPFSRTAGTAAVGGVLLAASVLTRPGWQRALAELDPAAPHLLFDWRPGAGPAELSLLGREVAAVVDGPLDTAACPHPGGPPLCWCRPPLPGLPLAFARTHGVDLTRSVLLGTSATHRTLATTLGARSIGV